MKQLLIQILIAYWPMLFIIAAFVCVGLQEAFKEWF